MSQLEPHQAPCHAVPVGSNPALPVQAMMLVATVLVASSFPVVNAITDALDSVVLTFLRFALATALFAPIVSWRYGLRLPGLRDQLRYGVLGGLLVAYFWCMFAALRMTSTVNTAAIFALTPVITAIFASMLLQERLELPSRIALPIGAVGAAWVVFRGDVGALMHIELGAGDVLFIAGTVCLAAYTTLVKLLHRGEPMARMTFWTLATGTVWLFTLAAQDIGGIDWAAVPLPVFAGIAYLAVFTTIVTFFIYQSSTRVIGPTRVVSYTFLNPALVLLIGFALGQPAPPITIWPGVVLVIVATLILQMKEPIARQTPVIRSARRA